MKKKLAKATAFTLAVSMVAGSSLTGMAASSNQVSEREARNAKLCLEAAEEGMVLLENKNAALPVAEQSKVALFGTGSYETVKGGTGSGDVNNRYKVTVYEALTKAYNVANQDWWSSYLATYEAKREEAKESGSENDYVTIIPGQFGASESYLAKDVALTQKEVDAAKANGADIAFYTVSRTSGEGKDRAIDKGDYYLSDIEKANIEMMAKTFDKTIVLLNVGGVVDTAFFNEIKDLDGLVLMSQGGVELGTALANMLTGKVSPSGKLSDTWAAQYSDYPASETIGNTDENALQEDYTEGVYVGYRYFDKFNIKPAYAFGYGMSYTDFDITPVSVTADQNQVTVQVNVKNTGDTYSGKEVVEVYFSAPDGDIEKPYQEMAAFGKTDTLAPGESQVVTVSYKTTEMSSYDEAKAAYVMEDGDYIVRVGNSSRNTEVAGVVSLDKDVITEQLSNQLTLDKEMKEISAKGKESYSYDTEAKEIEAAEKIALSAKDFTTENNASTIDEKAITTYLTAEAAATYKTAENETVQTVDAVPEGTKLIDVYDGKVSMESFVASLTDGQLANLANGISGAVAGEDDSTWGADANSVPGAAGETTQLYFNSLGIPNTVEADGPAGVRITNNYTDTDGNAHYSHCTAFPIGTMLAQTWNSDLIRRVGAAIGEEMAEFGITLWLAPGMNIHRDPLCGRNFEYYSEDPALTGYVGTAVTEGVQSNPGVGVTIKHYITNNQETSRNQVNTSVSERALREIYLKGFEMVVKAAQPMAIMSSYNKVNGTYACENFDLLTSIPRGEWGFDGMVMTDWGAGNRASVDGMMHAGNDLVMPGRAQQRMIDALGGEPSNALDSTLVRGDIQKCVAKVLTMIMRSSQFGKMYNSVNVQAHTSTYDNLVAYKTVEKANVKTAEVNQLESQLADAKTEIEKAQAAAEEAKKTAEAAQAAVKEAAQTSDAAAVAEAKKAAEEAKAAQKKAEELLAAAEFKAETVSLKSVKSKKGKTAKVSWTKVDGAEGYTIQYAQKSSFAGKKTVTVKGAKTNTTLKKLKKGKKCFVRVSAYKTINGKKVATPYSETKSVKVK